jgi:tetratricopeptide (TPR) repeat protein
MSLLTWEDAAPHAGRMAEMVAARRMPPWLPSEEGPPFRGERRLDTREIAMLRRWADAGAPRGDGEDRVALPDVGEGWILGPPDLVLEMPRPYRLSAAHGDGHDLYRNFVFPVPLDAFRWVRAVEFRPGNPSVVHHATLQVDPGRTSRLLAAADPEPGYDDRVFHSAARPPGGFFLAWTPGLVPLPYPEGMAWRIEPGTDLVAQLHLFGTGEEEEVSVQVGLHFTDEEPSRVPVVLRLGGQTIDIPGGDPRYVVRDSFTVPVPIEVLGVYPHAHFLGREVRGWAGMPDGTRRALLSIPRWDFDWQDAYYYRDPVRLPAGTTLHMRWTFDNSADNPRNPSDPPGRVVWGMNSTDEMAELWLQVVTAEPGDRERLETEARVSDGRKQVEGWRHLVALDPGDADAQRGLASVALAAGEVDEALRRYRLALEAHPGSPETHHGLGGALEVAGDRTAARDAYLEALRLFPGHPGVLSSLGRMLAGDREQDEARRLLERALEVDPWHAGALNNLGSLLRDRGEIAGAIPLFRRALEVNERFDEAAFNLALSLLAMGDREAGVAALDRAFALDPGNASAALSAAWILATHPLPGGRDPDVAVELALQLRDASGPDPVVSDVTAAALAAGGDLEGAIRLGTEAVSAAQAAGWPPERTAPLRDRLALYITGRAFVSPEPPR